MAHDEIRSTLEKLGFQVGEKSKIKTYRGAKYHPSFSHGENCILGSLANVGKGVFAGDNVYINGTVSHSILSNKTRIEAGAEVHFCISEQGVIFQAHSHNVNIYAEVNSKSGAYAGSQGEHYLLWEQIRKALQQRK